MTPHQFVLILIRNLETVARLSLLLPWVKTKKDGNGVDLKATLKKIKRKEHHHKHEK